MHSLAPFFPLLIILVVIPLVIWAAFTGRKRTVANLQKLADQLGLTFAPPASWTAPLRATGQRRGKPAAVFTYTTGSGKSRQTWAALTVEAANRSGFTFKLQKQGFGTKVMELFGAKEIAVGDPVFDAAWFVQTNRPEFFAAALIPELREKLMAARRAGVGGKFELKDSLVKYAELGSFADAGKTGRFVALADLVADLADVADVAGTEGGP